MTKETRAILRELAAIRKAISAISRRQKAVEKRIQSQQSRLGIFSDNPTPEQVKKFLMGLPLG